MAKINSSIGKMARSVNTAVKKGSRQAANAALKVVDKSVRKELKTATGIKPDKLVWTYKATAKIPKAKIQIATKQGINLSNEAFKPKEKVIRSTVKGAKSKLGTPKKNYRQRFYGVTVKIGQQPRQLAPDAFLRVVGAGKGYKTLVLKRRGSSRLPVDAQKTDIVQRAAREIQPRASRQMKDLFDKSVNAEISKALNKAMKSDKSED